MDAKTEKMPFKSYAYKRLVNVGKVPKLIFEKLIQKMINFEVFLVGKVPKKGDFNQACLENSDLCKL